MAATTTDFFSELTSLKKPGGGWVGSSHAVSAGRGAENLAGSLSDSALAARRELERKKPDDSASAAADVGRRQTQDSVLWLQLGLCKALVRAVGHLGFISPTPVQCQAIPKILTGRDCLVRAVTGSGKTAAYMLPMLHALLTRSPVKQSSTFSRRRYIRAVLLVPSRELGVQCQAMLKQLLLFTTELTVALAIGGVAAHAQEAALEQSPDVVIATPGRLVDLLHNYKGPHGSIDLSGLEFFILDECDRMLTVQLRSQVIDILSKCPGETKQLLLFSATLTTEVDEFAKQHLFEPVTVDVGHVALAAQLRQQFVRVKIPVAEGGEEGVVGSKRLSHGGGERGSKDMRRRKNRRQGERNDEGRLDSDAEGDDEEEAARHNKKKGMTSRQIRRQGLQPIDEHSSSRKAELPPPDENDGDAGRPSSEHVSKIKTRYLVALCKKFFTSATLVFTKYRTTAHRLVKIFNLLGMPSAELSAAQSQEERFEALRQFVDGEIKFLFCTDVASRGLDIKNVKVVVNFDLPPTLTAYIHRVGRTARIGESGTAVSLVHESDDAAIMRKILTVSGNINDHQVASVKRRDVPDADLQAAVELIDGVFPRVKELLAAEELEAKIAIATKMLTKPERALHETLTLQPKKTWCLSKEERRQRDEEARRKYETEAEVTIQKSKEELAHLDKQNQQFLYKQKSQRKHVREAKQRANDAKLAKRKEERQKHAKKLEAGVVKKIKKKKIRDARKEKRAENREKKGKKAFVHRGGRQANKKSRHKRHKKH
jgi:ATP-dependent RNA helicase DDX27